MVCYFMYNFIGDQALLDIRFPDVSRRGQGLHISAYPDNSCPYRKLTLWHTLIPEGDMESLLTPPKLVSILYLFDVASR